MDFKQIQTIIKDFEKSKITDLEIELEGFKIKLSKNNLNDKPQESKVIISNNEESKNNEEKVTPKGFEVKSPLVGTFYTANSPKDKPFVTVGQRVEMGQTLCIIEAMKIMNEITAPVSGVIEAINVKNGSPTGFDQVLMVIG